MDTAIPIIMIPGNMTDWRMYTPQLATVPQLTIPPWLPPLHKHEPIAQYAKRLVATLELPERYMFGGTSLGGMIAQEMAHHAHPIGVILIASCTDAKAIPWRLRMQGRLIRHCPDGLLRFLLKLASKMVPPFLTKDPHERAVYAQMLREMPPSLVRWQSGSASTWRLSKPLTMPVTHLHGTDDHIIRFEKVQATHVIAEGGHFINITHPKETNRYLKESAEQLAAQHQAKIS